MIEHFPEIRREANLLTTRARSKNAPNSPASKRPTGIKLEQAHGAQPTPCSSMKNAICSIISTSPSRPACKPNGSPGISKRKDSPDAGRYKNDTLRAFQTARHLYDQSQNPRAHSVTRQPRAISATTNRKNKATSSKPLHGGKDLSSEQRANLTPEARASNRTQGTRRSRPRNDRQHQKSDPTASGTGKGGRQQGRRTLAIGPASNSALAAITKRKRIVEEGLKGKSRERIRRPAPEPQPGASSHDQSRARANLPSRHPRPSRSTSSKSTKTMCAKRRRPGRASRTLPPTSPRAACCNP